MAIIFVLLNKLNSYLDPTYLWTRPSHWHVHFDLLLGLVAFEGLTPYLHLAYKTTAKAPLRLHCHLTITALIITFNKLSGVHSFLLHSREGLARCTDNKVYESILSMQISIIWSIQRDFCANSQICCFPNHYIKYLYLQIKLSRLNITVNYFKIMY